MIRPILSFAGIAGLLLFCAMQVQAYSSIRINGAAGSPALGKDVRWNISANRANVQAGRIRYVIGDGGCADTITPPANMSANQARNEFEAIQRSFNVWRDIPNSLIDFEFTGTTTNPREDGNDDINTVFWSDGFGPGTFAVTTTTFDTTSGEILDADLIFNDPDFVWDVLPANAVQGTAGTTYIENIAVHEIGHFLGLDHVFNASSSLFPFTDPGVISLISLEHDDAAPMIDRYPDPQFQGPTFSTVTGNVVSGGTGRLGVQVTLIDIISGRTLISAYSDRASSVAAAGDYRLPVVPPGNYWVVASPISTADMGAYYQNAFTNFQTQIRGVANATVGSPTMLGIGVGESISGINFDVATVATPFEPNNTFGTATSIGVGQALAARLETSADQDWYAVNLTMNQRLTIHVHADSIGSPLNPFFIVFGSNGTTRLLSGDFNDSTNPMVYQPTARDIENFAFGAAGLNFDARAVFVAPSTGTFYVAVRATGTTNGDYLLTLQDQDNAADVDPVSSGITSTSRAFPIGGANYNITATPRNRFGAELPVSTSRTVELIDLDNGNAVLGTQTGVGPWVFTRTTPNASDRITFGLRVDGITTKARLEMDFYDTLSAAMTQMNVVATSLVADGRDSSLVQIHVRDGAGMLVTDPAVMITLTTSLGTLSNGTSMGATLAPTFNSTLGVWEVMLTAPESGGLLQVTGTLNGSMLAASEALGLEVKASGTGGSGNSGGGSKSDGGGGCALGSGTNGGLWLLAILSLGLVWRRRRA